MTNDIWMPTYPKIDTYYDRGADFTVDLSRPRRPEFEAVTNWIFTEKVDGTNIRVGFRKIEGVESDGEGASVSMQVGGRSNNAQLPKPLENWLLHIEPVLRGQAELIMDTHNTTSLVVFGEGYGPKIQKGGGNYRDDQSFIVFDVLVDEKSWLNENGITDVAHTLGFARVPTYQIGTIENAIWLVQGSDNYEHRSLVALDNDKAADFEIEGVVARPLVPLYDGRGRRVMWKLKGSDFRAGKR